MIAAQVDAPVLEIPVRVGDSVKAGAVLVKLACKKIELERTRLSAEQQSIQARLKLSEWELKQRETLVKQNIMPVEEVQKKDSERTGINSDLAARRAQLEEANRQIAACAVTAPFAGVVTERKIAVGQYVAPGTALVLL